jgi:hypothetical protein
MGTQIGFGTPRAFAEVGVTDLVEAIPAELGGRAGDEGAAGGLARI